MSENGSFADAVTAAKRILRHWFENGQAEFSRGELAFRMAIHSGLVDSVLSQLLDEQLVERQPNKPIDPSRIRGGPLRVAQMAMGMVASDDPILERFSNNYRIRSTILGMESTTRNKPPSGKPPVADAIGSDQAEADGKPQKGKPSDHLEGRVARLEWKIAKPLRSDQAFVQQRLKFCCSKRTKTPPDPWSGIYDAYNAKFPKDTTASPGSLRHTHERHCPKCKKQRGQ